ncbi:MAG TPA: universal stress protein [Thermoanaerobaculia bacterium]
MAFRRILIPTDFSTASEWVFDDAVRIAGSSGGELLILHVRMTWASKPDKLRFPADPSLYDYVEQHELDLLRDRVIRANAALSTRLIVRQAPNPAAEICRTAREEKADLIVIATHARHLVTHLFVGSTTMSVIHDPPAPVLSIRYGIPKRTALSRIVVPVDLTQTSRPAIDLAYEVGTEVHIVAVCSEADHVETGNLVQRLAAATPGARTLVTRGKHPQEEIIRYANSVDADAIFLNAPSAVATSQSEIEIIRHAAVPVMVVPEASSVPS